MGRVSPSTVSPLCPLVGAVEYLGTWNGSGSGFGGSVSGDLEVEINGATGSVSFVTGISSLPVVTLTGVTINCSSNTFTWDGSTGSITSKFKGSLYDNTNVIQGSFVDSATPMQDTGIFALASVTSQVTCSTVMCSTGGLTSPNQPVGVSVTYPSCATVGSTTIAATGQLPLSAPAPTGYHLDNIVTGIMKPLGTATCPYVLTFVVDSSVAAGSTTIPVFENGAILSPCNPGTPPPNPPCVVMPETPVSTGTGVTVYSPDPAATFWTFSGAGAAEPVVATRSPLPGGKVGHNYSALLNASGGNPPYHWSIAGGHLPKGLSLSSSGVISGTPKKAGNSSFTVEAMDTTLLMAKASLSLSISH